REEPGQRANRLGLAQRQVATVAQCEGEQLERVLLQLLGEVDKHVAAQYQVNSWEGWALGQVMLSKDDQAAQLLFHLIAAVAGVALREIAGQELVREAGQRPHRIEAAPGECNSF